MTVILFGAKNCSGCTTVKRVLEEKGVTPVYYDVNQEEGMNIAMTHRVRSIPTLVFPESHGGPSLNTYVGEKACLKGIETHVEV